MRYNEFHDLPSTIVTPTRSRLRSCRAACDSKRGARVRELCKSTHPTEVLSEDYMLSCAYVPVSETLCPRTRRSKVCQTLLEVSLFIS
jgi:hypothetical protein